MFYALVYGNGWEDIDYFFNFNKARAKLVIQTRHAAASDDGFHPMLIGYNEDASNGTYGRMRDMYGIPKNKFLELLKHDEVTIKLNPELGCDLIEMVF